MQEININISQLRTSCQMFYCKAQVPGQQISTPPTLCTASFNRGGIWSQHMDAKSTQFLVWTKGLQKVQNIHEKIFTKSQRTLIITK